MSQSRVVAPTVLHHCPRHCCFLWRDPDGSPPSSQGLPKELQPTADHTCSYAVVRRKACSIMYWWFLTAPDISTWITSAGFGGMIALLCWVIHLQNALVLERVAFVLTHPDPPPSSFLLFQKHGLHFPLVSSHQNAFLVLAREHWSHMSSAEKTSCLESCFVTLFSSPVVSPVDVHQA